MIRAYVEGAVIGLAPASVCCLLLDRPWAAFAFAFLASAYLLLDGLDDRPR